MSGFMFKNLKLVENDPIKFFVARRKIEKFKIIVKKEFIVTLLQ